MARAGLACAFEATRPKGLLLLVTLEHVAPFLTDYTVRENAL